MTKKKSPTLLSRAVTLADGPHRLSRATWPAIVYVQEAGYVVGMWARASTDTLVLFGEWRALARAAADLGVKGTWTPEQVAEGIDAIDVAVTLSPDFGAIAAGLAALMRTAEPDEGWDVERVSALMLPARWESYRDAVRDLFTAGLDDGGTAKPAPSAEGEA